MALDRRTHGGSERRVCRTSTVLLQKSIRIHLPHNSFWKIFTVARRTPPQFFRQAGSQLHVLHFYQLAIPRRFPPRKVSMARWRHAGSSCSMVLGNARRVMSLRCSRNLVGTCTGLPKLEMTIFKPIVHPTSITGRRRSKGSLHIRKVVSTTTDALRPSRTWSPLQETLLLGADRQASWRACRISQVAVGKIG
jgi:hypothetical protein